MRNLLFVFVVAMGCVGTTEKPKADIDSTTRSEECESIFFTPPDGRVCFIFFSAMERQRNCHKATIRRKIISKDSTYLTRI